jgi:hypothetical protein
MSPMGEAHSVARLCLGGWLALVGLAGCGASHDVTLATPVASSPAPPPACTPSTADRLWMQETLDLWDRTSSRYLLRARPSAPWIVYFDKACVYHLAAPHPPEGARELPPTFTFHASPLRAWSMPHGGEQTGIELPNGAKIAPRPYAATSVEKSGERRPFYAMALMSVWSTYLPEQARDKKLSARLLTVAQHEMTHTLQISALRARLEAIYAGTEMPKGLNDDSIEDRFKSDDAYVAAFGKEVDLLFAAAGTTDVTQKKRLVREALELASARRARYFVGPDAHFAKVESLFLALEGPGEWVRLRMMLDAHDLSHRTALEAADTYFDDYRAFRDMTQPAAIQFIRGPFPHWSQDEGLALTILLEQLVPHWQDKVVGADLASPFDLLAAASS